MKKLITTVIMLALSVILALIATGCNQSPAESQKPDSQEEYQKIALEFVKNEATFRFDGMPDTLKVNGSTAMGEGWLYTIIFDSRHAGYGDRTGQMLAEVITPHTAEVIVQAAQVTGATMDRQWDMINQRMDVEIKPAPIHEVNVAILKSNPPQISVHIKGGLSDGCTSFHDIETTREGNTVNISVTVQKQRGMTCPAIYTYFEKDVNLGTDFLFGATYTLKVNDYSTIFSGTLMKGEGFAIYLTGGDIPPGEMEMLSHVEIADQPVISIKDIISYDAQTHEMQLTDEAFTRLSQLDVPVRGKSFLVCVDRAPIYWGAFWSPVSSISFGGIVIWKPLGSRENIPVKIELGYPSSSFYSGQDPRNDTRVMESLDQAGKLINRLPQLSTDKLPKSFKGYELYSWSEGGRWHFTLITGTNRNKTIEEVTSGENIVSESGWVDIHVTGVDAIKEILGRLPPGESVFWFDNLHIGQAAQTDLQLPPEQIVEAVKARAAELSLDLVVAAR